MAPHHECLIVADDLTGACDAAAPFATRGYFTTAVIDLSDGDLAFEVVALNTASRDLDSARIRSVIARAAGVWSARPARILFKKIDSTLRGQPAAEIAATLSCLASGSVPAIGVLAAAFPATGRTTIGGRVLVNGRALEETDLWRRDHSYPNAELVEVLATAGPQPVEAVEQRRRKGCDHVVERTRPHARSIQPPAASLS